MQSLADRIDAAQRRLQALQPGQSRAERLLLDFAAAELGHARHAAAQAAAAQPGDFTRALTWQGQALERIAVVNAYLRSVEAYRADG